MPQIMGDKPIYVEGGRPKPNVEVKNSGHAGGFAPFIPDFIKASNWQDGTGGGDAAKTVLIFKQGGDLVFSYVRFGINVRIPLAEWGDLSFNQQRTIAYVLQYLEKSDRLVLAFAHYANEGVTEIVIRYGPQGWRTDGTNYSFSTPEGIALAEVSADSNSADRSQTDLLPGGRIVISINSNDPAAHNLDFLAEGLIHELMHPWVPNELQPNGVWTDHDRLENWDKEEFRDIFPNGNAVDLPVGAEAGEGFLGSRHEDNHAGTMGNDVMAGMEGNDVLNGLAGADLLTGGPGMDTLIAGPGFSDLRGGIDADTYVASDTDSNFYLEDTGGVDRLVIAGSANDFVVTRTGDNLSIWSNAQGYAYEIVDHYVDGKRIEIFQFADAEYSASYLEYLAAGGGGPGVCYQDGYPVICGQYGMPVVIDLDGDGAELVEANKSRVRWDVDGDGKAERVGWTNGDDAFLVLDRNANGTIDSFAELSFLSDFRGAGSDLEGLLAYDDNRDGFLTAADPVFARLQLWRDANGDGVSQPGELVSLEAFGAVSIGLEIEGLVRLDQSLKHNQLLGRSDVQLSNGSRLAAVDAALYFKSHDEDHGGARDGYMHAEPQPILVPETFG